MNPWHDVAIGDDPDRLFHCVIEVPAGSVEALRSAIDDILRRPDRGRSLGEEGRKRVRERFDWRACGKSLDRLYRDLLGRGGLPDGTPSVG